MLKIVICPGNTESSRKKEGMSAQNGHLYEQPGIIGGQEAMRTQYLYGPGQRGIFGMEKRQGMLKIVIVQGNMASSE